MKTHLNKQVLTVGALSLSLLIGSGVNALATLQLKLSDNLGNSVTITDNGPGDRNPVTGSVEFVGAVGPNWFVNVTGGTSKPITGTASAPELDLVTLNVSSGAGILEIQLTDTDFTSAPPVNFFASIGGTTAGSVSYDTWADPTNVAFAKTTAITTQGPFSTASFSGNETNLVTPGGSPFSLTMDMTINHAAGGQSGFDANLLGTPVPPSANCAVISNAVVGVPIVPVTVVASGGCGAPYTFSATGLPPNLTMSAGGTISGTPIVSGSFGYSVIVSDACGNKSTNTCSVSINPPPSANCAVITNAVQGIPITPVTVVGSGGCGGPYTFTATGLPANLTISSGGTISGTPAVNGSFSYSVIVTDACGNKGTNSCSVNIGGCNGQIGDFIWHDLNGNGCQDPSEPGIGGVLVNLYAGCGSTNLIMTTLTDTNGHYLFSGLCPGDYQVSITTPAGYIATIANQGCTNAGLPPDRNQLDSKCSCGTSPCLICVTLTAANPIDLNVDCGYVTPPSANCAVISNAVVGVPIVPVTVVASGGCGGPYTFNANGLPLNLTMSSGGTISGTPAFSGIVSYSVVVTDACGNKATNSCSVSINPPPSANCAVISNAVVGVPIVPVTVVASGGCGGPYTFNANGLPLNLTMSSGGTISGTPIVSGSFSYNVIVSDACGNTATNTCLVSINPPPSVNCAVISNAVVGVPIVPVTVVGSGGCGAPYTFSATGLPANLTMSSGGTISGTPIVNGTFGYTVIVSDACGNTATNTCSVSVNMPQQPSLILVKTAVPTQAKPGQPVTYFYAVTNTGAILITNINIVDDNGTPSNTNDDFFVNSAPFSLAPGQGTVFPLAHISEPLCVTNSGTNFSTGTLTINVLVNGDVEVFYNQSQSLNDNRYGTGATAATGWPGGHKFMDLVGSDEATFLFTDSTGKQVLEFQQDYISQATSAKFGDGVTISYPSGYGTLGPLGGDGKMLIGGSSNVLSCHTTFSDTLNMPQFTSGYLVNSAPETSPLSNVSVPPGWNYTDGYYVKVSHNAFGAAGFGGVTIPLVHNSPSKLIDQTHPTNVCSCVKNTAMAYAVQGTNIIVTALDDATVCFGPTPPPGLTLIKSADKTVITNSTSVTYTYTVQNTGGVTITNITITDDNGTPSDPADDFVVGTIASLAPGDSQTFTVTKTIAPPAGPQSLCTTVSGTNMFLGTLAANVLSNGDVSVVLLQSQGIVDNRYGTNATAATGWPGGHKFSDLTGSDQAVFQFTDGKGNVVLLFSADYISAATGATFGDGVSNHYASGYGTLGELGGDGSLTTGSKSNILSVHTTISDDLNQSPAFNGFTVNSPKETSPLSNVSIPPGWNYTDGYSVLISHQAFGSNGFGGVTIPYVHDSPSKIPGTIKFFTTNCLPCVVNVATATGVAGTNSLTASAHAQVCFH